MEEKRAKRGRKQRMDRKETEQGKRARRGRKESMCELIIPPLGLA